MNIGLLEMNVGLKDDSLLVDSEDGNDLSEVSTTSSNGREWDSTEVTLFQQ